MASFSLQHRMTEENSKLQQDFKEKEFVTLHLNVLAWSLLESVPEPRPWEQVVYLGGMGNTGGRGAVGSDTTGKEGSQEAVRY